MSHAIRTTSSLETNKLLKLCEFFHMKEVVYKQIMNN